MADASTSDTIDLILGTAGHIDHGKTALVRALTGVDTDRLPEEKRRGITIDLGFAELRIGRFRLGVVDVPGHERFVRNMLAGAAGMDLAMLVVAADDSVKPQTREHLEILRLLDLKAGVIALTKCDLVEREWLELVEEEVRELTAGTFLDAAPLVRTSAATGEGLARLRRELERAAAAAADRLSPDADRAPFRMAIDRAFTVAGHGTVVTGSVSSGTAALGDELEIQPSGLRVRVRGLQNHDRVVERVRRGQRAAVNLAGVHHEQIRRGQELAAPGHLRPSRLMSVRLSVLAAAPRPLRHRAKVRVHLGAAEWMAGLVLLDRARLAPGETALAQLVLSEPAVATWRQPLVVRSESPVTTIGGGRVLDPAASRLVRRSPRALEMLERLDSDDPARRSGAALYFAGLGGWRPEDLARTAGVENIEAMASQLRERGELCEVRLSPTRTHRLHREVFDALCERIAEALEKLHAAHPLAAAFDPSRLLSRFRRSAEEGLLQAALDALQRRGRVRVGPRGVALAGRGPKLSQNERKLLERLVARFREAGAQPPSVDQCRREAASNQQAVPQLLAVAAAEGALVEIAPQLYLHAEVERQLRQQLAENLADGAGWTVSQIRELLGTTRKYAVPYCEYLDRIGFTERRGDVRVLAGNRPAAGSETQPG